MVTEYAWDAGSCDPCPTPALVPGELATLGADVVGGGGRSRSPFGMGGFVLTRLHARYAKDGISEDLVFKAAEPIVGGREQGRYAIRHEWTGPIACDKPVRGQWGGPPGKSEPTAIAAGDLAFVPRGKIVLAQVVRRDVPEIGVVAAGGEAADLSAPAIKPPAEGATAPVRKEKKGCGVTGQPGDGLAALLLAGLAFAMGRRRARGRGPVTSRVER